MEQVVLHVTPCNNRYWAEQAEVEKSSAGAASAMRAIAATAAWSPAATDLSGSMLNGNFAAQFPIDLIEKDFGYAVNAAGSAQARRRLPPRAASSRGPSRRASEVKT